MQNFEIHPDAMLRLSLLEGQARAFLVESTQLVERARSIHNLSRTATAALGRTLTMTSILGAMLKGKDESVTVRVEGNGPAGMIMAVGRPDGTVKGFMAHPGADVPRRGEKLDVGALVGREGTLTVIKDLRLKEPYVGQVPLQSGEIGEDFALYFTSSEQTPSLVSVGVLVAEKVVSAGALVIQLMPGASESAIMSIENSAGMFMDISKTLANDHLEGTCEQLLTHLQPELLEKLPVAYHCGCSRKKVEKLLMQLGEKELEDMIREQGGAQVDCHFCNTRRNFTAEELRALIKRINDKKNESQKTE